MTQLPQVPSSPRESTASALTNPLDDSLPPPTIDPADLDGPLPPDGIQSLEQPKFERASSVTWISDTEPVIAVEIEGEARSYPIQILIWHEIVNDTIGGEPIAVTYCPLCNSAIGYRRRLGDRVLEFGVSGKLYKSDLVMYDRQTESIWPQFAGEAVAGKLTGEKLEPLAASTVSWRDWRGAHPNGWVLSRDTGHDRPYGTNPMVGYDDPDSGFSLYRGKIDGRLHGKARVVGISRPAGAIAIDAAWLADQGIAEVTIGRESILVWHIPGMSSALDSRTIEDGREVGSTAAFDPVLDGKKLTFTRAKGDTTFVDVETKSEWNGMGVAISGPLLGRRLTPIEHVDTFWFAWAAFKPTTEIVGR